MPDINGMMTPEEVQQYQLSLYLQRQQLAAQTAQGVPGVGQGAQIGNSLGQLGGKAVGAKLFTPGAPVVDTSLEAGGSTPVAMTGDQIAGITGDNGMISTAGNGLFSQAPTGATAPTILGNAGAMAGTLGGAGALGGIAAGTYLAGKAGYDMLQGKKPNLLGRIQLGISTGGLSELVNALLGTNHWQDEQNSVKDLATKGVTGWDQYAKAQPQLSGGRSIADLVALAKQTGGNEKFAASRNEADLTPGDIVGYSAFGQKYGNDWFGKFSADQRTAIAKYMLDAGAVREHQGTISLGNQADSTINDYLAKAIPAATATSVANPGTSIPGSTVTLPPQQVSSAPTITFIPGIGGTKIPVFTRQPQIPNAVAPITTVQIAKAIPRASTRSPGIDLKGNRIKY